MTFVDAYRPIKKKITENNIDKPLERDILAIMVGKKNFCPIFMDLRNKRFGLRDQRNRCIIQIPYGNFYNRKIVKRSFYGSVFFLI